MIFNCTDEEFSEIVVRSTSIAQVMRECGLPATGRKYRSFYDHVERLSLDTSHMSGRSWRKGMSSINKRPIELYLSNKFPISSSQLKTRLLDEGLLEAVCQSCGLRASWNGQSLVLQLDHIDGDHTNNNLENLRILCPNCHSQTPTFCGADRKKRRGPGIPKTKKCLNCDTLIGRRASRCKSCAGKARGIRSRPSADSLKKAKQELKTWRAVAREFNVSDTCVRKWFKFHGLV